MGPSQEDGAFIFGGLNRRTPSNRLKTVQVRRNIPRTMGCGPQKHPRPIAQARRRRTKRRERRTGPTQARSEGGAHEPVAQCQRPSELGATSGGGAEGSRQRGRPASCFDCAASHLDCFEKHKQHDVHFQKSAFKLHYLINGMLLLTDSHCGHQS